jgi:hypothetical protein
MNSTIHLNMHVRHELRAKNRGPGAETVALCSVGSRAQEIRGN